jgi:hypothetical protein
LPPEVRLGLAVAIAVAGLLFAILQPGGRPLDQWLLAGVLFVALPRRLVWRPGNTLLRQPVQREQSGLAELALHPDWVETSEHEIDSEPVPQRRALWWRRRS